MSGKVRVGVLLGGASAEREISLASGHMIAEHLPRDRYEVVTLDPLALMARNRTLSPALREKAWALLENRALPEALTNGRGDLPAELREQSARAAAAAGPATPALVPQAPEGGGIDVAFLALHGRYGEDGTLQGLLDLVGIPYVGSGTLSSALAMDKVMAKKVLAADGLPVPAGTVVERAAFASDPEAEASRAAAAALPAIVKPVAQGSSVGLSLVTAASEMRAALEKALAHDRRALVEERLLGAEITVGVIGNRELQALPVVEIVSKHALFDYQSKYDASLSEEICPARIPQAAADAATDLALRAHRSLGCRGLSRTDMILTARGPVVLEVNTLPGMTVNSLLPKAARVAGIPFPELLDRLVQLALEPGTDMASHPIASPELRVHKVVCPHDCPDTCVMTVGVEGGRAVSLGGDPEHRFTQGFLCAKVNRYLERVYSPDRLLHPLRRVGRKGEGRFSRITWDEALDEIAARFREVIARHGPQAILPYSYAGNMGMLSNASLDRRFFQKLGASFLDRTICASAGGAGYRVTLGKTIGFDPEAVVHARFIVAWGANIVSSNVHLWPFVEEARRRGATLVAIDPYRSRTAEHADRHLALYPGTDAALALGMMHVIFREGLEDRDYLDRYTVGAPELRERAKEWTPARTAAITGLPEAEVDWLARAYATIRPSAIRVNYGLNRHAGGGMAVRTISCLPAVTGAWRDLGGGILLSTSGTFPVRDAALERPDLAPPGTRTLNMSQLGRILADEQLDPPVKALFVYNSNPAAVAPEQEQVLRGLRREDLFTVVHELFQTDTVDFADVVLPATTALEHYDIHKAYGHLHLSLSPPAIAPLGESKANTEVFRLLAAKLGLQDPCLFESDEALARQAFDWGHPHLEGTTFERLEREGSVRLSVGDPHLPFANGGFPTASGKCEMLTPALLAQGLDPLAGYVPPREGPTSNPALAERYPLAFISPPAHHFLNSTFSAQPVFVRRESEPYLTIHPEDAGARGIVDGSMVRVFNDRGSFQATARVSAAARLGVVVGLSIWWAKMCPGGRNANAVTGQDLSDLGAGATFYDVLVQVAPHP